MRSWETIISKYHDPSKNIVELKKYNHIHCPVGILTTTLVLSLRYISFTETVGRRAEIIFTRGFKIIISRKVFEKSVSPPNR